MSRFPTLHLGLGALVLVGSALAGGDPAEARITVLDDDGATIARALALRPDGGPGLRLDDNLNVLTPGPTTVPRSRHAVRVTASELVGRGPAGMAALLREGVRTSGVHRVFVDDIGFAFGGQEGNHLAQALGQLAGERPPYAPRGVSRRVHLYVGTPGPVLSDPAWEGVRSALRSSGGVWLKTFSGESQWGPAEWLAWPAATAAHLGSGASARARVHVVLTGDGRQAQTWALGRTGSACAALSNGPAGYRLANDVDPFVAEYRRTLAVSDSKLPAIGCTSAPALTAAGAVGLERASAFETTGLEIPPGGLVTPPLPAGSPAQVTLQLGSDPTGLAASLGISSEQFWGSAQARVEITGPGVATIAAVAGDGSAGIEFTPTAPGPVTMDLVIDQGLLARAMGAEPEVVTSLQAAGVGDDLVRRVVADPSGWQLTIPLVPPGSGPGTAVLEIVPPPT